VAAGFCAVEVVRDDRSLSRDRTRASITVVGILQADKVRRVVHYEKRNGEYALVNEFGDVLFTTPELAVVFSQALNTLHKHGPTAAVHSWLQATRAKYRTSGLQAEADDLVMIVSDEWDLEELNRCISICDYVGRLYEKLQPYLDAYDRAQPYISAFERAEKAYRFPKRRVTYSENT
jgi:hypothetical protein